MVIKEEEKLERLGQVLLSSANLNASFGGFSLAIIRQADIVRRQGGYIIVAALF